MHQLTIFYFKYIYIKLLFYDKLPASSLTHLVPGLKVPCMLTQVTNYVFSDVHPNIVANFPIYYITGYDTGYDWILNFI